MSPRNPTDPNELLHQAQRLIGLPEGMQELIRQGDLLGSSLRWQLDEIKPALERFDEQFVQPWKDILTQTSPLAPPLNQHIQEMTRGLDEAVEALLRGIEEFPAQAKEGLLAMAKVGWYLDPNMPEATLRRVKDEIEALSLEEVNAAFANYFRAELDRIEASLTANHPVRANLIASAFKAHRSGSFELAIPVLLAQADGISRDIAGCQLYNRKWIGYVRRSALEEIEKAYFAPLTEDIPLWYSEQQRGAGHAELNRHAVMHGETVDYGTEENSLKAISLLNYVSYVLSLARPNPSARALDRKAASYADSQAPTKKAGLSPLVR